MKPIIIRFNEENYNHEISKTTRCAGYVQHYIDQIKAINGLTITPDLFKDIVAGKGDKAEEAIITQSRVKLTESGITNNSLTETSIKGDREEFWKVFNNMKADYLIDNSKHYLSIDVSGKVLIPEAKKEEIKKGYTSLVTTERGKKLYDLHKKMIDSMNDLAKELGKNHTAIKSSFSLPPFGQKEIHMQLLGYDYL